MDKQDNNSQSPVSTYHSGVTEEILQVTETETTPVSEENQQEDSKDEELGELQDSEPAKKEHPGGQMPNKIPLLFAGSVVAVIVWYFWSGMMGDKQVTFSPPSEPTHRAAAAEASSGKNVFSDLKNQADQSANAKQGQDQATGPQSNAQDASTIAAQPVAQPEPVDYEKQARIQKQMMQDQMDAQEKAERRALLKKAMEAPSTVYSVEQNSTIRRSAGGSSDPNIMLASNEDAGEQPLKGHLNSFEASSYLPHTRTPAISPYEVKAGTVIPSVMISGINSQLPGQLIAQVSQNVYDSATGKYLLIPQGSRLVGTYDNSINTGQKRVMIAWHRIIYPDASSLNLEAMSGQDQSGYGGFKDKVNNHTAARFGEAILLSAITAGVQLSQPRTQKGDYSYSAQQVMAGSLGMQMNQLGMQSFQNRGNLAPTLTIRPGYRFVVMVSKDMILPPWEGSQAKNVGYQAVSRF